MANAMSDIGTGISLQGKVDTHDALVRQILAQQAASKKPVKDEDVKLEDFSVYNKDLLPRHNKRAAEIAQQYTERAKELYRQLGSWDKANNALALEKYKYQEMFANNKAASDNIRAAYTASTNGHIVPNAQEAYALANDVNTTPETWLKLNDPENIVSATEDFNYTAPATPIKDLQTAVLKHSGSTEEIPVGRPVNLGNYRYRQNKQEVVNEAGVNAAATDLVTDHDLWQNFRAQNKNWAIENGFQDALKLNATYDQKLAAAKAWSKSLMPIKTSYDEYENKPLRETEAEKKVQNVQPETGTVVTFTNPVKSIKTGEQVYVTPEGKEVIADEKTADEKKYTPITAKSNFTAEKAYNFNKELIQITPEHSINLATGAQEKPSGSRDYEINQVAKIPVVKNKKGEWILAEDKTVKEFPQSIKYKWYALGLEKAGTQKGEEVNLPRAVPLTDGVLNQLKNRKVNLMDFEGVDKKSTNSTIEEFNVGGKTYRIPKDKVAEFKKDMGL